MYCQNCGCKVSEDAMFCSQCGEAIGFEPAPQKRRSKRRSSRGKSGILKLVRMAALAVAVIAGGFFLFRMHRNIAEIPDPKSVFGASVSQKELDNFNKTYVYTVRTQEGHSQELDHYLAALMDASGIQFNEYLTEKNNTVIYQYRDTPYQKHGMHYAVTVTEPRLEDGYYETTITVYNVNNCKLVSVSASEKSGNSGSEESNTPQKAENSSASVNADVLPDFFDADGSEHYDRDFQYDQYYDYSRVVITATAEYAYAAPNYIQLLTDDYGYTLVDHYVDDQVNTKDWYQEYWYLQHPNEAVGGEESLDTEYDAWADVEVYLSQDFDYDWSTVTITYVSAISYEGVQNMQPSSHDSGNSGITVSPVEPLPKIQTNCSGCFGDGEVSCSNCGGAGYKTERQSVANYSGSTSGSSWATVNVRCYKCSGTGKTTCSRCGGSGKN